MAKGRVQDRNSGISRGIEGMTGDSYASKRDDVVEGYLKRLEATLKGTEKLEKYKAKQDAKALKDEQKEHDQFIKDYLDANRKNLLDWNKNVQENLELRRAQTEAELKAQLAGASSLKEKLGAVFKAGAKDLGTNLKSAAANAVNNIISKSFSAVQGSVDSYLGTYTQYMSKVEARIQGAYEDMTYASLNDVIRRNTAGSPYVKYVDVLDNLSKFVEQGITSNLTQRAFLATVKDKIATTFDAFNSNMLRLIRIQQSDSTLARLGMEASLTKLFNNMFGDTSYLNDSLQSVSAALLDVSSQFTSKVAVEFEYITQKWLGALGSLGVGSNTLTSIASAINALGTGDVDYLTSNTAMQSLLVMAANRSGQSYADMLTKGVNADQINNLLAGVIEYVQEITQGQSNVVKSQYASLFGLTMADISAFENVTQDQIKRLYSTGLSYNKAVDEVNDQLNQVPDRMHLSEKINILLDNALASIGTGVANNAALYGTYKAFDILEKLTGGTKLPLVFGSGSQMSIESMAKSAILGISSIGALTSAVQNWASGNAGLNASRWQSTFTQGGVTGFSKMGEMSTSKSSTNVFSTSSTGIQQSVLDTSEKTTAEITGDTPTEGAELKNLLEEIRDRVNTLGTVIEPVVVQFNDTYMRSTSL